MSEKETILDTTIELVQTEPGVYEAVQVKPAHDPPSEDGGEGRQGIDWSFGPIKYEGYIDANELKSALAVYVLGISLGNIYGDLRDGSSLKIDLFHATGSLRFYLKNGNEFWTGLDIKVKFNGSFEGDYKIITI